MADKIIITDVSDSEYRAISQLNHEFSGYERNLSDEGWANPTALQTSRRALRGDLMRILDTLNDNRLDFGVWASTMKNYLDAPSAEAAALMTTILSGRLPSDPLHSAWAATGANLSSPSLSTQNQLQAQTSAAPKGGGVLSQSARRQGLGESLQDLVGAQPRERVLPMSEREARTNYEIEQRNSAMAGADEAETETDSGPSYI